MYKKWITYNSDHPNHHIRVDGYPQHAEKERDKEPASPLLKSAIGHGVIGRSSKRQGNGPHHLVPQSFWSLPY